MLIMGVSTSLGLAIYALNASTSITKQIVAAGLAREGVEAVKAMRDTNWLKQTTIDSNCYNYLNPGQTAKCYKNWLKQTYCINPKNNNGAGNCNGDAPDLTPNNYVLYFDSTAANFWTLQKSTTNNFGLFFYDPKTTNTWRSRGFYSSTTGNGMTCVNAAGRSDYCRRIILTRDATAPYNHPAAGASYDGEDVGPMLKVQSQVWWVDKKCPRVPTFDQASTSCRLEIITYLTNWKNY